MMTSKTFTLVSGVIATVFVIILLVTVATIDTSSEDVSDNDDTVQQSRPSNDRAPRETNSGAEQVVEIDEGVTQSVDVER